MTQKVLIMVTFGEDFPDRLEPPVHLATLSATLDTEVQMIYTMSGGLLFTMTLLVVPFYLLLKKGNAERIVSAEGKQPYIEMIREIKEFGVKVFVCSPTLERYGLTRDDFVDEVDDIVGGMYAVTEALESDLVFTF